MSSQSNASVEAKTLAKRILKCDPALQWVTILNKNGETLLHLQAEGYTALAKVRKETETRLGVIDSVLLEAFTKAERWYGKEDFIVVAYSKAKLMLMRDRQRNLYFVAKIPRSGNATYLHRKIEAELKK